MNENKCKYSEICGFSDLICTGESKYFDVPKTCLEKDKITQKIKAYNICELCGGEFDFIDMTDGPYHLRHFCAKDLEFNDEDVCVDIEVQGKTREQAVLNYKKWLKRIKKVI